LHLNGKPDNHIRKLLYSRQHQLLFCGTDFGLYVLKDTTFYLLSYPNGPDAQSSILSIVESKGAVYFTDFTSVDQAANGGFFKLDINENDLPKSKVTEIIRGEVGFGCTATDSAIYFSLRCQIFKYQPQISEHLTLIKTDSLYIAWSMATFGPNKIALGGIREDMYLSGIKVLNTNNDEISNSPFVASETSVNNIIDEPTEKITWFCTNSGLYGFKATPFETYNSIDATNILDISIIEDKVYVLTESHIWMITEGQWKMLYTNDQLERIILDKYSEYSRAVGIPNRRKYIYEKKLKSQNFCTDGNQTYLVTLLGTISFPDLKTCLTVSSGQFITKSDGSAYWVPAYYDLQYSPSIKTSPVFTRFEPYKGKPIKDILKISAIGDTLYFASFYNGLYAMVDDQVHYLNSSNSKLDNLLSGMEITDNNEIWCTSKDGNLFHVGFKDSLRVLQTFNHKNSKIIGDNYKWLKFSETHLYIGTNKGLNKIPVDQLKNGTIDSVYFFNQFNGYGTISAESPQRDSQGNIYVFNHNKVIKIADQEVQIPQRRIVFSGISIDNSPVQINLLNNNNLQNETKNIRINFLVSKLPSSKNVKYRYRINGSEWNDGKEIFLQSLKSGSYTISCEARDIETSTVYSESLSFRIDKPFWLRGWFLFLSVLTIIVLIYLIIHLRFVRLARRKEEKGRLTREIAELHIQSLQSQMNPHFVFNSLNSVQNFILSNKIPEAANYLSALGKLIRINLEHVSAETITLTDEIVFLEQFINIEKLRFKQALDVTLTCSIANIDQVFLPPMLIQPLVENSIKYGTRSGKQVRSIRIEFGMNNGLLVAAVTDNGIGRNRSLEEHDPGHKSVGLNLIKERLDLLNKKNNTTGFQIVITDLFQDGIPIGTKVQVTAPQLDRIV
jgi:hypothetical protein